MTFPRQLNIGSGKDFREDYLNLDVDEQWSPDILYDLNCPLPEDRVIRYATERFGEVELAQQSFDQIIAYDVLEHVPNLTTLMKTCLDLLRFGGVFEINVPYDLSLGAWQDPTHIRAFNENSWLYYTEWSWYLGWSEARFAHLKELSYRLSPYGTHLNKSGKHLEEILATPRAVDSMVATLEKVPLTDQDIDALNHFRRTKRRIRSATPIQDLKHDYCIWIVAPPDYPHCDAYVEVALGLQAAFRNLGHDAPIVRDPVRCQGTAIVLGANQLPQAKFGDVADDSIIFNLEQVQEDSPWMNSEYLQLLSSHKVWDYSDRNIQELKKINQGVTPTLCEIGYESALTRIVDTDKQDIDILFYGSINGRRRRVLDELKVRGLNVVELFGTYGDERDAHIARAKIVLNVHFYEAKVFELVRVSYLLANSKFVITERSSDSQSSVPYRGGIVECAYEELVDQCLLYVNDNDARQRVAQKGFELFRQRSQTTFLRKALEGSSR